MKKTAKTILSLLLAFLLLTAPVLQTAALTMPYTPSSAYAASSYYTAVRAVQLTGHPRIDLINVAVTQFGYHEGNSEAQLGGGNQNGSYNYTEYGYWYGHYPLL